MHNINIDATCVEQQGDIYKFDSRKYGIKFIIPTQYFRSVVGQIKLTIGSMYLLQFFEGHLVNIVQQIQEETKIQIQDVEQNSRPQIKTTDKIRRPIEQFETDYIQIDRLQERIQNIQTQFPAWRKVAQDGNQFYRSIGVQYVEFFARQTTSIETSERIINQIQGDQAVVWNNEKFPVKRYAFVMYLQWILRKKQESPRNALLEAQKYFQMRQFDKAMIYTIRGLAASYYEKSYLDEQMTKISKETNFQTNYQNVITYGSTPQHIQYSMVAYSLPCQIVFVDLNHQLEKLSHTCFPSQNTQNATQLYTLYYDGNFEILYPENLIQTDGYNLSTGEYYTTTPVEEIHHPIDNKLQQLSNQN